MNPGMNNQTPQVATPEVEEKLASKMMAISLKQKEQEAKSKATVAKTPYINLVGFPIRPEALSLIDEQTAKKLKVITFFSRERDIRIGAVDPSLPEIQKIIQEIEKVHDAHIKPYLISDHSFEMASKLYDILPKIRETESGVKISAQDYQRYKKEITTFKDLEKRIKDVSMTDMVTLIIASAVKTRSSDIHIEADEKDIKIRFRIDGLLQNVASIDKKVWPKVISRIKLLAKLKINISTRPQDGRFTIFLTDEKIDVRVSALPTNYGESVVMRLLMSSAIGITLEDLGLRGKAFEDLKNEIQKPNGMLCSKCSKAKESCTNQKFNDKQEGKQWHEFFYSHSDMERELYFFSIYGVCYAVNECSM